MDARDIEITKRTQSEASPTIVLSASRRTSQTGPAAKRSQIIEQFPRSLLAQPQFLSSRARVARVEGPSRSDWADRKNKPTLARSHRFAAILRFAQDDRREVGFAERYRVGD